MHIKQNLHINTLFINTMQWLNIKIYCLGSQHPQLHQGGGGLRVPGEPGVVLLPDRGVQAPH